ncbi:unnamed protein product [Phyllotreta striolata]|uniref:Uncharacterized protein n=1 Tax=Phyllotreta striolata TaxID=444603 RepID=A0A9N9XTM7_PHYSR|nr:unnamed protein product [Phyllotreta striolata]
MFRRIASFSLVFHVIASGVFAVQAPRENSTVVQVQNVNHRHGVDNVETARQGRAMGNSIYAGFITCAFQYDAACFVDVARKYLDAQKRELLAQADEEVSRANPNTSLSNKPSQIASSIEKLFSELTNLFRDGLSNFFGKGDDDDSASETKEVDEDDDDDEEEDDKKDNSSRDVGEKKKRKRKTKEMEVKDEQRKEILNQFQKALEKYLKDMKQEYKEEEEVKDDKSIFQKFSEYFNEESKVESEKPEEQSGSFFQNILSFFNEYETTEKPQVHNETFFQQLFSQFKDEETIKEVNEKPEEESPGLFGNLFSLFADDPTTKKPEEQDNTSEQSNFDKVFSNFMKKKNDNKIEEKNAFQKFISQFVEDTTKKPDKEDSDENKKVLFQEFMTHFIEETKNKRKRENLSLIERFLSMFHEERNKKSDEIPETKTLNFDLNKIENFLSEVNKSLAEMTEKFTTTEKFIETTTIKEKQVPSTTKNPSVIPEEEPLKTVVVTRNQTINIFPYTSEKPPSIIEKVFVMEKSPASEKPMIFLIEGAKPADSTSPKAKKKEGPIRKLVKFIHKVMLGIVLLATIIFLLRFFYAFLALTRWLLQFKSFLSNAVETYLYLKDYEFSTPDIYEQYVVTTNDQDTLPYYKKWEWEDKTQQISSIDNSVDDPWILED